MEENRQRDVAAARDRVEGAIQSHLIDPRYLWSDDFDAYFDARHRSLLATIGAVMGKPVSDSVEEPDEAPADYELVQEDSLTFHPIDDVLLVPVAGLA